MKTSFVMGALMAAIAVAVPNADLMGTLPGAAPFDSETYSGYLPVTDTKKLHYVFAKSLDSPETDPVVVWFNGGPGCSSMLGFMQENGPRVMNDNEAYVTSNSESWIKNANVMWLESPAGVGWSVGVGEDLSTNDMITSQDALTALQSFYDKFPEFLGNDLYLSGESYAGIYVPYLAWQIYENNLQAGLKTDVRALPLTGIMVGNGVTDWRKDTYPPLPNTGSEFQVFAPSLTAEWKANGCKFIAADLDEKTNDPKTCEPLFIKMMKTFNTVNIYDLYRTNSSSSGLRAHHEERVGKTIINGEERSYKRGHTHAEYTKFMKNILQDTEEAPVLGDMVTDYMNWESTREAFNIPSDVQAWEDCTNLNYEMQAEGSIWIYPVLRNKIRIMIYSGDTDGCVPTYGTKQWIEELGWPETQGWRPLYTDGQVSGFGHNFEGLDFYTVKGVGHMAPQWARKPVTDMMMSWIHGQPI